MVTTEVIPSDERAVAVRTEAANLCDEARGLAVVDEAAYTRAGEIQQRLRAGIVTIEEYWEPHRRNAKKTYDDVLASKKEMLEPVQKAYDDLGSRAGGWFLAEKRKREEAARLQRIEQEKAEREAREKQRKAEELAKKKHLPPPPPPAPPPPPPPVAEIPKVAGAVARTTWDFEVVDAAKLPREYMVPDEKKIRAVVKAMKEGTKIPGVRVFETAAVSGRA